MTYNKMLALEQQLGLIETKQKLLKNQTISVFVLVLSSLIVWGITSIWPEFFVYTYFSWEISMEDVFQFWPLLLWGLVLSTIATVANGLYSSTRDEELLGLSLFTGWIAAIWEEFAYRWIYVCFGMVSVVMFNWVFGTVLGWVFASFFLLATVGLFLKQELMKGLLMGILSVLLVKFALVADPLYWLYQTVTMPLLNFMSFGSYSDIVDPSKFSPLFVMGAILANSWFRDGHKYQGPVGILNSWMIGFVLLYAALTYGLLTAVVVHGLWNTQVAAVRYVLSKTTRLT